MKASSLYQALMARVIVGSAATEVASRLTPKARTDPVSRGNLLVHWKARRI